MALQRGPSTRSLLLFNPNKFDLMSYLLPSKPSLFYSKFNRKLEKKSWIRSQLPPILWTISTYVPINLPPYLVSSKTVYCPLPSKETGEFLHRHTYVRCHRTGISCAYCIDMPVREHTQQGMITLMSIKNRTSFITHRWRVRTTLAVPKMCGYDLTALRMNAPKYLRRNT